jgi:hypothetical protein
MGDKIFKVVLRTAALITIVWVLQGCSAVPLTQISKFGEATSALAGNATEAFRTFDDAAIEREIYRFALDSTLQPADTTFERILEKGGRRKARFELLEALSSYGKSLQAIASANLQDEIDAASLNLFGALVGLDATVGEAAGGRGLGTSNLGILATGVQALASVGIEKQKQRSLKAIVIFADSTIQRVTGQMSEEFRMLGRLVVSGQKEIEATLNDLYFNVKGRKSFDRRIELLSRMAAQHRRIAGAGIVFDQLSENMKRVGEIHSEIRSAMEEDRFSSAALAVEIGSLVKSVEHSKKFLESLK